MESDGTQRPRLNTRLIRRLSAISAKLGMTSRELRSLVSSALKGAYTSCFKVGPFRKKV
jgi:hypothetical protein